jgi:hypothetical protein
MTLSWWMLPFVLALAYAALSYKRYYRTTPVAYFVFVAFETLLFWAFMAAARWLP